MDDAEFYMTANRWQIVDRLRSRGPYLLMSRDEYDDGWILEDKYNDWSLASEGFKLYCVQLFDRKVCRRVVLAINIDNNEPTVDLKGYEVLKDVNVIMAGVLGGFTPQGGATE